MRRHICVEVVKRDTDIMGFSVIASDFFLGMSPQLVENVSALNASHRGGLVVPRTVYRTVLGVHARHTLRRAFDVGRHVASSTFAAKPICRNFAATAAAC